MKREEIMGTADCTYSADFFVDQQAGALSAARYIVPIIMELLRPNSVLDVGCGEGAWLSVFNEMGVEDVLGIDGGYVDRSRLSIAEERFLAGDLEDSIELERSFDLALCLEVAEHLTPKAAHRLVRLLVRSAPNVLFGAAIPGQGGVGHLNEQWPGYWVSLFERQGRFPVDVIRSRVWDTPEVAWWYAQNTLLFVSDVGLAEKLWRSEAHAEHPVLPLVHPRHYNGLRDAYAAETSKQLLSRLPSALRRSVAWHVLRRR